MAEINSASDVLEPSCGKGDLMDVIHERCPKNLIGVEINKEMFQYLCHKPYTTMVGLDFFEFANDPNIIKDFNRIIMNPPFSMQQDVDHVLKAFEILRSGGILVSVMSPGAFFRSNKKSVAFREWLKESNAEIVDLDAGEFKSSGTMIASKIIKIFK